MNPGAQRAARPGVGRGPDPGATAPEDLLRVAVSEPRPGVLVLTACGEVDVSSAGVLRKATDEALSAAPRCLVVDLGGVTFCGSTGLVVLMEARERAEAAGVRFATADGTPIVRRVLEITKLGPVLEHRATLDEALRAVEV